MNRRGKSRIVKAKPKISQDDLGLIPMDQTITKYCGGDWMSKLSQITGDITTIDIEKYKEMINKISISEKNVKILLKKLKNIKDQNVTKITSIYDDFCKLSLDMNFLEKSTFRKLTNKAKQMKVRPTILDDSNSTEQVSPGYTPEELVKSEWFVFVKNIETTIYQTFEKIFISPDDERKIDQTSTERKQISTKYTYDEFQLINRRYTNIVSIYPIFGIQLRNRDIFDGFMQIQKYLNIIINLILTPLYDVHSKIDKSYDKYLSSVFKTQISAGKLTKDLVVKLLADFVTAKYRASITGNNKYFLQIISEEITEGMLSSMDGARFVEIMDTINLDSLDKGSRAINFTIKAKDMMKKMIDKTGEMDISILQEVKELLDDSATPELTSSITLPDEITKKLSTIDSLFHLVDDPEGDEAKEDEISSDVDE